MNEAEVRRIKREFGEQFMQTMATGLVEDGDQTPVVLNSLSASIFCAPSYAEKYGCPKGEVALLVTYIPAGMEHTEAVPGVSIPKEAGVNPDLIVDSKDWVLFPKSFQGLPVYYIRGSQFFAL